MSVFSHLVNRIRSKCYWRKKIRIFLFKKLWFTLKFHGFWGCKKKLVIIWLLYLFSKVCTWNNLTPFILGLSDIPSHGRSPWQYKLLTWVISIFYCLHTKINYPSVILSSIKMYTMFFNTIYCLWHWLLWNKYDIYRHFYDLIAVHWFIYTCTIILFVSFFYSC